jgi:hypothetical protein
MLSGNEENFEFGENLPSLTNYQVSPFYDYFECYQKLLSTRRLHFAPFSQNQKVPGVSISTKNPRKKNQTRISEHPRQN